MGVRSLDGEDPLEEEMATCSSILAWKTRWTEEPGGATVSGVEELDMTERRSTHTHRVLLGEGEQSKATRSLTTAIPNQKTSRGSNPRGTLPPQHASRVKPQMDR